MRSWSTKPVADVSGFNAKINAVKGVGSAYPLTLIRVGWATASVDPPRPWLIQG